jgi:predicted ATPase
LASVASIGKAQLAAALDQLVEAGLIFRQATTGEVIYAFKHALVQDVAYESLLRAKRRQLHARIAMILEERFTEAVKQRPELLARHFAAAGLPSRAITCWQMAADLALTRSANAEAVAHLQAAIGLLAGQPEDAHRQRLELDLQLALGGAAIDAKGLASTDVETAYRRAQHLAGEIGDGRCEFTALWGLWRVQFARADAQKAGELADGLMRLAEHQHDPELLLEGLHAGWGTGWYRDDLVAAWRHAERGRMLYDQQQHGRLGLLYGGHDLGACCLSTSREWNRQAYALAGELGATHTFAHTWCWATILPQLLYDIGTVQHRARDLHTIATEHGLTNYLGQADVYLGWVLAREDACTEGIEQMRRGLALLENAAGGAQYYIPYFRSLLADGYARAGRSAEALASVDAALADAERVGDAWYHAELLRRRGQLVLLQGCRHEAEDCFRRAAALSSMQSARAWELRAVISLARLCVEHGEPSEARDLLALVYGWFTEGFGTPDLREARALLDELASAAQAADETVRRHSGE